MFASRRCGPLAIDVHDGNRALGIVEQQDPFRHAWADRVVDGYGDERSRGNTQRPQGFRPLGRPLRLYILAMRVADKGLQSVASVQVDDVGLVLARWCGDGEILQVGGVDLVLGGADAAGARKTERDGRGNDQAFHKGLQTDAYVREAIMGWARETKRDKRRNKTIQDSLNATNDLTLFWTPALLSARLFPSKNPKYGLSASIASSAGWKHVALQQSKTHSG